MSATSRHRARGPILVLSAFEPELTALRLALARADIPAAEVSCLPAGIGAIDAAAGAARAIAAHDPRAVLFVGTAGSYGAQPPVGGVIIGRRLCLVSTTTLRREGYLPTPMIVRLATDTRLRTALARTAEIPPTVVDVATPLAITTQAELAQRVAEASGASVENLEAFAVARAAALAALPCGVVLGVSNQVGPAAHAQWMRHQHAATRAAASVVQAFLTASLKGPNRSALAGPRPSPRLALPARPAPQPGPAARRRQRPPK